MFFSFYKNEKTFTQRTFSVIMMMKKEVNKMVLKKDEIEIIKLLISSSQYLTSYDIATATGINRRLVRDEMLVIKEYLKSLGYELISKTSKGYMLKGKSSQSLHELSKIIENAERERESVFPTMPIERQNYIVKRLIDHDDYIKIDTLADELLVSRSTISSDLKQSRQSVQKYNLSFQQKPNYGIRIIGDEVNKRKPLADFLFSNLGSSEMFYDYLHTFFTQHDSLEYGIIHILKEYQIEMSDIALCDFLLCLSISISRIMVNHVITQSPDLSLIENRIEFTVAKEIASFVYKRVHCHFNEHEINQIAIQLICKRSTRGLTPRNDYKIQHIMSEILQEIEIQTLIHFNDFDFERTFQLYLENSIFCILYNEKTRNPLYNELKTTYPIAYELAEITSSVIEKYYHKPLSMSSLALFATLFNTAINKNIIEKKKVLLLSGLGGGSADFNAQIILEKFETKMIIKKASQYYKLPEENLKQYDFIISTVPIHNELPIPYINVSQIITQDDLVKIESYISYDYHKNRYEVLFHPKLYKCHVKSKSYKSLMNEFYKMLKSQYPTVKESLKNNLLLDEYCSITYLSNKISIAKIQKPINNNRILSVVILEEPLIYQNHQIQMMILFSYTDADHYLMNTLTNTLNHIIHNKDDWQQLFLHPTYLDFLKILSRNQ